MVHLPAVAAGDRAGGAGRGHGAVPGHAHVHHLRPAEDRHEGRGAPARPGAAAREGDVTITCPGRVIAVSGIVPSLPSEHRAAELLAHMFVCWAVLSILCWIFDIPIQSCCHEAGPATVPRYHLNEY